MYIVRWLMGYPIIAAWVLAAIAFLLVLGDVQEKGAVEQKTAIKEQSNDSAISLKKESTLPVHGTETGIQEQSKHLSTDENIALKINQKETVLEGGTNVTSIEKHNISVNSGSIVKNSESSISENLSSSNQVSTTVSPSLEEVSANELLQMARESFWNNGFDEAADLYKKLIELQPTVIEHKGELGNVYWKQGYPKKAAKQYLEIAAPMIESGNSEKVANMIGFIGIFYPKQAAELSNKIQSSK